MPPCMRPRPPLLRFCRPPGRPRPSRLDPQVHTFTVRSIALACRLAVGLVGLLACWLLAGACARASRLHPFSTVAVDAAPPRFCITLLDLVFVPAPAPQHPQHPQHPRFPAPASQRTQRRQKREKKKDGVQGVKIGHRACSGAQRRSRSRSCCSRRSRRSRQSAVGQLPGCGRPSQARGLGLLNCFRRCRLPRRRRR